MFNATGENKILRRHQAEKIIKWIDNETFQEPSKRVIIHGEKGVGKTMSLHQIAHHGMAKDMLVLYVGNLWRVATKNYATEPLNVRKDVTTQGYVSVEKRDLWESRYDPLMQQGSHRPELKSVITYDQVGECSRISYYRFLPAARARWNLARTSQGHQLTYSSKV